MEVRGTDMGRGQSTKDDYNDRLCLGTKLREA